MHFLEFLLPNGILPGAKFTLRPSLSFSYRPIGSVTARHLSSGRQPNFEAFSSGRHLYSAGRPSRWPSAHILVCQYDAFHKVKHNLLKFNCKINVTVQVINRDFTRATLYDSAVSSVAMASVSVRSSQAGIVSKQLN